MGMYHKFHIYVLPIPLNSIIQYFVISNYTEKLIMLIYRILQCTKQGIKLSFTGPEVVQNL